MTVIPPPPTEEVVGSVDHHPYSPVGWVRGLTIGLVVWILVSAPALFRFSSVRAEWQRAEAADPVFVALAPTSIDGSVGLDGTYGTLSAASFTEMFKLYEPAFVMALVLIPALGLLAKTDRTRELRMAMALSAASLAGLVLGFALIWLGAGLIAIAALTIGYVAPVVLLGLTRGVKGAALMVGAGILGPNAISIAEDIFFVTQRAAFPTYLFPFLMLPVVVTAIAVLGRLRPSDWFVRPAKT